MWLSSGDDGIKFGRTFEKIVNSNFHCHIWIKYEKCIQMSTNKPTFGLVVLKISHGF